MRLRPVPALCLALLLLGLAWSLSGPGATPLPTEDEAALTAAALPFYALLGERGSVVFNMAVFLLMAGTALWLVRDEGAALFVAGFFFASATFGYVFRADSPVPVGACLFFALVLWQRTPDLRFLAGGGVLLGLAFAASPLTAILGIAVLIDLLWRRRWAGAFTILVAALLVVALVAAVRWRLTGEWAVGGAGADLETGLRLLPRNLWYLLAGRHAGLLPYFPFALLGVTLYLTGTKDRARTLLAGALGSYCLVVLLAHPHDFQGGSGALGNRFVAAVYPVFFLLPGRLSVRRGLVLPYAAAGLWTAGAVLVAVAPGLPDPAVRLGVFRVLPLELTLLGGMGGGQLSSHTAQTWGGAIWVVPRWSFFTGERHPNGVWVRGATRSEVVVVSPKRLDQLRFTVYALSPESELVLDSGVDRLRVRFDTEGKRQGTPVDLAVEPAARDLGFFPSPEGEFFYRFSLTSTGGVVPARVDPKSVDERCLGVFLDFTGAGGSVF